MNRAEIHFNIFYALLIIGIATLPFSIFLQLPVILLLFVNFITEWNWKEKIANVKKNGLTGFFFLFIGLYLLYFLGTFYSQNLHYALSDLECKLFFLITPLVLFTTDSTRFHQKKISTLFNIFILSCTLLALTNLAIAGFHYASNHEMKEFFYNRLSHFMHPSYGAMYVTTAFLLSLDKLFIHKETDKRLRRLCGLSLCILLPYLFMLQSKAGMLMFVFSVVLYVLYILNFQKRSLVKSALFLCLCGLSLIGLYRFTPIFGRMDEAVTALKTTEDSNKKEVAKKEGTVKRTLIWECAWEAGTEHLPFGTGTGDVKQAILQKYQDKNYTFLVEKQYNAHCQYLQTFVALGLLGIFYLLAFLGVPALIALRRKDYLYVLFLFVVGGNLLVECMFEVRAGCDFIALFNVLFCCLSQQKKPKSGN